MAGRADATMKTSTAVSCMKTILMIFNIYILISGLIVLSLGIWLKVDLHKSMELTSSDKENSAWLLIAVGLWVILMGAFGCCCTIKGISSLLYVYGALLILVFVLDWTISITAFVYRAEVKKEFQKGFKTAMSKYEEDKDKRVAVDHLQEHLGCCGSEDFTDWYEVLNATRVPSSCCKRKKNCVTEVAANNTSNVYPEGCDDKVGVFMEKNFGAVGGVTIAFCFLQLLGALAACCLAKNINSSKYEQVA